MLVIKITTVFLILIVKSCLAKIVIKPSEFNESLKLVEATVNILTSCYSNRGNAIGVIGEMPKNFVSTLLLKKLVPIVLLSNQENIDNYFVRKWDVYPVKSFVIGTSSYEEFVVNLQRLENSNWWNHMGSFIILCESSKNCPFEKNILLRAFRRGVINPKIIRLDRERMVTIVAGNPYPSERPDHWHMISSFKPNNHAFYVYSRKYEKGLQMCNNLDFVSTKNLWGYDMRALADRIPRHEIASGTGYKLDTNYTTEYYLEIFQHVLNGTLKLVYEPKSIVKRQGVRKEFPDFSEMYYNRFDLHLSPYAYYDDSEFTSLFPHDVFRVYIMTKFRGHKTQLEKLLSVIDLYSRIAVCLVMLTILIFFKFIAHQKFVPALLNVIRITCNTGFMNIPEKPGARFYISSVLFLAVTMHGIYGGLLASLLTSAIPRPDINNLQDLIESNLAIYGYQSFYPLVKDTKAATRFVPQTNANCGWFVVHDSFNACVYLETVLVKYAKKFTLHISREPILSIYSFLIFNRNYPHIKRLNEIILTLQAAGIHKSFNYPRKRMTAADFVLDKAVMANVDIKVMTLKELAFAFGILGSGLICATITFIVELGINRYHSRIRSVKVNKHLNYFARLFSEI